MTWFIYIAVFLIAAIYTGVSSFFIIMADTPKSSLIRTILFSLPIVIMLLIAIYR